MFYDTIVQLIQNFLQYCESKENFRVDLLAQEINQIMKNPIFAIYYSNILELSEKLDLGEKYYRIGGIRETTFLVKKRVPLFFLNWKKFQYF